MSWAAMATCRRYWLDEASAIGAVLSAYMAALVYTWGPVNPDFYFRGLFFLGITGAGLAFYVASGTIGTALLIRNRTELVKTLMAVAVGLLVTRVLQFAIILTAGGFTVLAMVPADLQRVYLMEAALSETFFVFGIFTFLAARLHWVVGFIFVFISTGALHSYVYGLMPGAIPAVIASFLLQACLLFATHRFSVPMLIHVGWNW